MPAPKGHLSPKSITTTWLTPPWIFMGLGGFDLDPCAAPAPRPWTIAKENYDLTQGQDGLILPWQGKVWLNPPFGRPSIITPWVKKLAEHGNGIALIPAATETNLWHNWVWPRAERIVFLKQRPHFCYPDGTMAKANCGFGVALIGYGRAGHDLWEISKLGFMVYPNCSYYED